MGGAIIPTLVSLYLLWKLPSATLYTLIGIVIVATIAHLVTKLVKGLGIATPAFIPPLTAALAAYILPSGAPTIVAYVSGVKGWFKHSHGHQQIELLRNSVLKVKSVFDAQIY
jgi:uncharacterized membrane protein